jgi:hypothetical protein
MLTVLHSGRIHLSGNPVCGCSTDGFRECTERPNIFDAKFADDSSSSLVAVQMSERPQNVLDVLTRTNANASDPVEAWS